MPVTVLFKPCLRHVPLILASTLALHAYASVTVQREEGVEIITSKTAPAIQPASAAAGRPTMSSPAVLGGAQGSGSLAAPAGAQDAQRPRERERDPADRQLAPDDPLAGAQRGEHRLRANLLNADGTPNEEADDSAHQMVHARLLKTQTDLKETLQSFDNEKRNGAPRAQLARLQQHIQADLDVMDMLARSQQN